jgi:hypothetical protein
VLAHLAQHSGAKDTEYSTTVVKYLFDVAQRISENRIFAGLHFPVDLEAGEALGLWLGRYFLATCEGADFDSAAHYPPKVDVAKPYQSPKAERKPTQKALNALYNAARAEWSALLPPAGKGE